MIKGITYDGKKLEFPEVLELSLKNEIDIPYAVVKRVYLSAEMGNEKNPYSITGLLDCPRKVWLSQKHYIYPEFERLYWFFRGNIIHDFLAYNSPIGAMTKIQLEYKLNDEITITGEPDYYYYGVLEEYKTIDTNRINSPLPQHILQLKGYIWLLTHNKLEVKTARLIYFSMKKLETFFIPVQVLEDEILELTKNFFVGRAIELNHILKGSLPPNVNLPDEERWKCQKKYCVYYEICKENYRG